MRVYLLCLGLIIFSVSATSQWYESQGIASIKNGDTKAAKAQAVQNALKKALLVAGASVSSVQQVVNGLLTQDEISIRASGSVNSLELVREQYNNNTVTVTIRADIFPKEKQCFAADYKKSLLLTRSNILHREQANIGKIYNLDKTLMRQLANKIQQQGLYLNTTLALQTKTEFSRLNQSLQTQNLKNLSKSLAAMADSQYVLFSEIQDLSLAEQENNPWQFWQQNVYQRHFKVAFYIHDGATGERLLTKQYHNSAPWRFDKRQQVDVTSHNFWQSDYGQQINFTLEDMVNDIDENMMCQPSQGRIVQVNGNQITFNLGKRHGVQVGDEFSLLHLHNIISDDQRSYPSFNISPYKVIVHAVSQDSAHATTKEQHILDNIQINDLVVRY
ncbi:Flagellar assembly protein T, C-terminal domain [Colwellia chukchiensis]|uniref:Flagellar assembly protein T, C-terminal domain n=1 Tax=Colwellia chukchiensis TaxID=641665 RepID=A0A1H7HNF1_9GAMM|nr:flagellar assembly protein T N-terminal domain-containing protein [Colwellia chukchiensis]SEK50570.1 Flagellar assembly protein T, C-terminal domain [Colwellia chukchiensis]